MNVFNNSEIEITNIINLTTRLTQSFLNTINPPAINEWTFIFSRIFDTQK